MLLEYDIVIVSQKAIKGSAIAEFLADRPADDYEPMKLDFPDEDIMAVEEDGDPVDEWTKKVFHGSDEQYEVHIDHIFAEAFRQSCYRL